MEFLASCWASALWFATVIAMTGFLLVVAALVVTLIFTIIAALLDSFADHYQKKKERK